MIFKRYRIVLQSKLDIRAKHIIWTVEEGVIMFGFVIWRRRKTWYEPYN